MLSLGHDLVSQLTGWHGKEGLPLHAWILDRNSAWRVCMDFINTNWIRCVLTSLGQHCKQTIGRQVGSQKLYQFNPSITGRITKSRFLIMIQWITKSKSTDRTVNEHIPCGKATNGSRAFSSAGPMLWNNFPNNLRTWDFLESFKSKLKTFLFKHSYLSST